MTLDPARPFFISPPFGSYLRHSRAYSVLGSYTRAPRPGRTMQVLRTVRPLGREPDGSPKGWLNKVGLRNAGWDVWPKSNTRYIRASLSVSADLALKEFYQKPRIVSLAPLADVDWYAIERWLDERFHLPFTEINVSCPNVDAHPELPPDSLIKRMLGGGAIVIFKLAPVPSSVHAALRLADLGARYIHLSNTLPTPAGGISGPLLREVNLPLVEKTANALDQAGFGKRLVLSEPGPNQYIINRRKVELIAGGGIYAPEHLRQYRDAGATRFSLATAWFWPPRALRVMRSYR